MYMYTYINILQCVHTDYMLAMTHHLLTQVRLVLITDSTRHHHKCILSFYIQRECTYTHMYMRAVHLKGHIPAHTRLVQSAPPRNFHSCLVPTKFVLSNFFLSNEEGDMHIIQHLVHHDMPCHPDLFSACNTILF